MEYFIDTSYALRVRVREGRTNSYINDATVTFALYRASGAAVSGGSGTCDQVAGSQGVYAGVISHSISLSEDERVEIRVLVTHAGRQRTKSIYRRATRG